MEQQAITESSLRRRKAWRAILEAVVGFYIMMLAYGGLRMAAESLGGGWMYVLFSGALAGIYLAVRRIFHKGAAQELKLRKLLPHTGAGFALGAVFMSLLTLSIACLGCYGIETVHVDSEGLLDLLAMYLLVAVGEELIFRGIVFRVLDGAFGTIWALAVSALMFGFIHAMNPGASLLSSVAITIEAGIMLAIAYKATGCLWLPVGIHWAWNFFEGPVFGFAVSGTDGETRMIESSVSGSDLITGGAFGPEASLNGMLLGAALSVILVIYFRRNAKAGNPEDLQA